MPVCCRSLSLLILLTTTVLLTGCAMPSSNRFGTPSLPYPPDKTPVVGDILHLPTGVFVLPKQMLAAATDSRVVYVGETHDNPASHRLQLDVLRAMADRYPGQLSLGMEMFNTEQQAVLDRWVAGEIDEKTFLKESDWYGNWRMDFAYYQEILDFAREQRIPVLALNAPKDLVDAVGETPVAEMPADLQDRLPEMDMTDPYQRAMSEAVFADHPVGEQQVERFIRVQTLWDEIMAANVAEELQRKGPAHRMVVLAGGNHVRYGFGIPRRVFRRLPVSYTLIGGREIEVPKEKQARMMDVEKPDYPLLPYDYLVFTSYESLPGDKVMLGIQMKEEDGQVVVSGVMPESTAAAAGVSKGDVILKLGTVDVQEMFDLVYEVGQKQTGDETVLTVERDGERLELPVLFKPLPEHH